MLDDKTGEIKAVVVETLNKLRENADNLLKLKNSGLEQELAKQKSDLTKLNREQNRLKVEISKLVKWVAELRPMEIDEDLNFLPTTLEALETAIKEARSRPKKGPKTWGSFDLEALKRRAKNLNLDDTEEFDKETT